TSFRPRAASATTAPGGILSCWSRNCNRDQEERSGKPKDRPPEDRSFLVIAVLKDPVTPPAGSAAAGTRHSFGSRGAAGRGSTPGTSAGPGPTGTPLPRPGSLPRDSPGTTGTPAGAVVPGSRSRNRCGLP